MTKSTNLSQPTIYVVAGAPAAGKTSFVAKAISQGILPASAFVHDCDLVMESLSDYQKLLQTHGAEHAFKTCELPARELAEAQLQAQIKSKADVIYDRSCALPSSYSFIKDLVKNHDYKLIIYMLHVAPHIALARALNRQAKTGRHIPETVLNERLQALRILWPDYLQLATEAHLIDSCDVDVKLIARYKDQSLYVEHADTYSFYTQAFSNL